jgi:ABC-type lipoprotein release transport system permease subunit
MLMLWLLSQLAVLLPARRASNIPPALATRSV